MRDWTKGFFRKDVFWPGDRRHLAAAPAEARFARRALGLRAGDRILDLCCGVGRHSVAFARQGLEVTGLDATPAYLRAAKRAGRGLRNLRFVKGDMRRIPFRGEFDAVVNLWTSFGYFPKEADDRKVLSGIARALKPGGRFLIDCVDADYLRRHGKERTWSRRDDGAYLLEDWRMFEGADPHQLNTWTILKAGRRPVSRTFFVRSYDQRRFSRALRRAGLVPVKRFGGKRFLRLVVLARKPARKKLR